MTRANWAWIAGTLGLGIAGSGIALAQSTAEPGDYIRRHAPDVVMPSTPREPDAAIPRRSAAEVAPLGDAVLRGAVGHVPSPPATCRIRDDRGETAVQYERGLPVRASRKEGDVREELTTWTWDAERVLLERESWSIRVKRAASGRGASDTWTALQWRVESTQWDSLGRPLVRETTDGSGEATTLRCEWFGFRRGECSLGGVENAAVQLTVQGEVASVTWTQAGSGLARGLWTGTWQPALQTVTRARTTAVEREEYRYNPAGQLTGFRRWTTLPRGERVVTWSLRRDERGNVSEVQRRCEGPCEGMRGPSYYRIAYDATMQNTFCGAWWDDGIEPTLRGW